MKRSVCVLVFAGLVFAAFCSGQKSPARSASPASQPGGAAAALAKIKSLMDRPRDMPRNADPAPIMKQRLPKALSALAEMEQKYPKAGELHEARLMGVFAAIQLARINKDTSMAERAKQIVGKIIASDAPVPLKLRADAHLLLLNIKPVQAATTMPTTQPAKLDTTKAILQFTKRYAKTDQAVDAVSIGMQIARIETRRYETEPAERPAGQGSRNRLLGNLVQTLRYDTPAPEIPVRQIQIARHGDRRYQPRQRCPTAQIVRRDQ
jgi:hypothetical protein